MYPSVKVNIDGLNDNIRQVKKLCHSQNIKLSFVVKALSGNTNIISKLDLNNFDSISDSRVENLKDYQDLNIEKWLIRVPAFSEIEDVIRYSDASLNSSLETILLLNEEARKQNKVHKIILMYELGDLREGVNYDKLAIIVEKVKDLPNIKLYGIGSNLTCYGGIAPSLENTNELYEVKEKIERTYNIRLDVVTGANSSSYKLLLNGSLKDKMNYVRFGESILLGMIPGYYEEIPNLHKDNFIIEAEIIELEEKPSFPRGEILKNSFGEIPTFEDKGLRLKALINLGKQDTGLNLKPIDKNIKILDGSSDYIILDLTGCEKKYSLGDKIEFIPNYEALLKVMTSKYVKKIIVKKN